LPRPLRLEGINLQILLAIANSPTQCSTPKRISDSLGVKQTKVFKHSYSLRKGGYLTAFDKTGYVELTLTPKATNLINTLRKEGRLQELWQWSGKEGTQKQELNRRGHALAHYYPLKDPIPQKDLRLCLQQSKIAYKEDALNQLHFTYEVTAELFSTYLVLFAPALYQQESEDPKLLEANVKHILDKVALKLERQLQNYYSFKFKRTTEGALISYYSKEELATERHPIAQAMPDEVSKVVLARDEGGKERILADTSMKTFSELETVSRITAGEDSKALYEQFKDVEATDSELKDLLDPKLNNSQTWTDVAEKRIKLKDINEMKEVLNQQIRLNQNILNRQNAQAQLGLEQAKREETYVKNIEAHSLAISKLNLVLDRILAEKAEKPKLTWLQKIKGIFKR
jgi:hypothetical protein